MVGFEFLLMLVEFVPIIEETKCGKKSLRQRPVRLQGPLTLEQYEEELRNQWTPLSEKELSVWEPSGLPVLSLEEIQTQFLQETCPNVVFTTSIVTNGNYESVALYQSGREGRLTCIEVQAKRIKTKDRFNIRVSLDPIMGKTGENIIHDGTLALVDPKKDKRIKVKIKNGIGNFYKVNNGIYALEYCLNCEESDQDTPLTLENNSGGVIFSSDVSNGKNRLAPQNNQ